MRNKGCSAAMHELPSPRIGQKQNLPRARVPVLPTHGSVRHKDCGGRSPPNRLISTYFKCRVGAYHAKMAGSSLYSLFVSAFRLLTM